MARIEGIQLPDNSRIDYALTLLYGVGWPMSKKVLKQAGIAEDKRVKELNDEEINSITKALDGVEVEGDLKRKVRENIQRLIAVGSYIGIRHLKGLPAHGQRTRTNARTKRGKRKTVGAFKKEMLTKMQPRSTSSGQAKQGAEAAKK
ncbi:30S ribosomal protein S13 [Candidatus Microgenomates bacterium]|nr:30S ribosomal protein S13 [Candidatus Microgenomates bacterium]